MGMPHLPQTKKGGGNGASPPMPGRVGRFRLLRPLGRGGMAVVYLAEAEGEGGFCRQVALKLIHPHLALDPAFASWFNSEARLGGMLHHPNLVATLDYGQEEGHWYMALEYIDGCALNSLFRRLQDRGRECPSSIVLQILIQLCRGLEYAHRVRDRNGQPMHLVHRDIKPANVLLDRFGMVKLGDFGVARAESNLHRTEHTGALKGSMRYMSPEQAQGRRDIDWRSDLFALGVLSFTMLTGRHLYQAETDLLTLRMAQDANVQAQLETLPEGPLQPLWYEVLRKALAYDRRHRFQSAAELEEEFSRLLNLAGGQPVLGARWLEPLFQEDAPVECLAPLEEALEADLPEVTERAQPEVLERALKTSLRTARLQPEEISAPSLNSPRIEAAPLQEGQPGGEPPKSPPMTLAATARSLPGQVEPGEHPRLRPDLFPRTELIPRTEARRILKAGLAHLPSSIPPDPTLDVGPPGAVPPTAGPGSASQSAESSAAVGPDAHPADPAQLLGLEHFGPEAGAQAKHRPAQLVDAPTPGSRPQGPGRTGRAKGAESKRATVRLSLPQQVGGDAASASLVPAPPDTPLSPAHAPPSPEDMALEPLTTMGFQKTWARANVSAAPVGLLRRAPARVTLAGALLVVALISLSSLVREPDRDPESGLEVPAVIENPDGPGTDLTEHHTGAGAESQVGSGSAIGGALKPPPTAGENPVRLSVTATPTAMLQLNSQPYTYPIEDLVLEPGVYFLKVSWPSGQTRSTRLELTPGADVYCHATLSQRGIECQ